MSTRTIRIVGITGRKRSGKDTAGKILVDEFGFTRLAFADSLKKACQNIFGFSDEQVFGDELKEVTDDYWGHSPREFLQYIGTELFREKLPELMGNLGKDIWIRSVERQLQNLVDEGKTKFVITDVRFPNELEFIAKHGGTSLKAVRPALTETTGNTHASEIMIDDFVCDVQMDNDSSLDDFNEKVREFARITLCDNNDNRENIATI